MVGRVKIPGQISMFDAPAGQAAQAARSCRTCAHASILTRPRRAQGAAIYGYCFKRAPQRYPIYMPDAACADWRAK